MRPAVTGFFMHESRVLNKLRKGDYALCTQIGSANPGFAGIAALTGFDCIWLDCEHKGISAGQIRECILAATLYNCDTVVRINKRSYSDYFKPLEDGATGIMVPHCKNAEDAQFAVANSKFAPLGMRGMDYTGLCSDYMMKPASEVIEHSLKHTFTMLQIEDIEALDNLDEITAIAGVDILFVGPADLEQSARRNGKFDKAFMDEVFFKVNSAVSEHKNVFWGTTVGTPESALDAYTKGARFISVRGDYGAVQTAFNFSNKTTRELIGAHCGKR